MPGDPLENPNPPAPEPRGAPKKLKCEFCECTLAANGDVLIVSDRARKLRKADEEIESLEGTVATLRHQIEERAPAPTSEIPAPEPEKASSGFRWY